MTLYVFERQIMGDGHPSMVQREASLWDVLTDRGWVLCDRCEGDSHKIDRWTCPDCCEGLVPPDDQVEAAAEAIASHQSQPPVPASWRVDVARVALVAAARKEKG